MGRSTGDFQASVSYLENLCILRKLTFHLVELSLLLIVRFLSVVFMSPIFLIPGFIAGALGAWIGNIYIKAQLSVKREMTKYNSPVISHFNASIAGLGKCISSLIRVTYKF